MKKQQIDPKWVIESIKSTASRIYDEAPSPFFLKEFISSLEAVYAEKFCFPALTPEQKEQIAESIVFRIKLFQAPSLQAAC